MRGARKTVVFLRCALCEMNRRNLEAVRRIAERERWLLQVVDYDAAVRDRLQTAIGGFATDLEQIIKFLSADGIIVDCGGRMRRIPQGGKFRRIPLVALDGGFQPNVPGSVRVGADNRAVAECAARELLALGYAHYAYLPWPEPLDWDGVRHARFGEVVRSCGRELNGDDLPLPTVNADSRSLGLRRGLSRWLSHLPKPCGIFAANDIMAQLCLEAALADGLRVPADVAIVGVDNDREICENAQVSLSSVHIVRETIGRAAGEALSRMMAGEKIATPCLAGDCTCVRRASSRLLPRRDAHVSAALEYVRRHLDEGLSPVDVAAAIPGCSRRLLDLRFRELTGKSVLDAIHEARLERVKELIAAGVSLAAIPDFTGYRSLMDLRRVFRQREGISIQDYRRSVVKGSSFI